ncbi:MAG: HAD-IIA family hydrolase [Sulfurimonas sp.]
MYFLDIQGTLISDSDKSPIAGSIEFINMLNKANTPYMLVTNNTKQASFDLFSYLKSLGFNITFDKYIDPLMILEKHVDKESVAAYGSEEFLNTLTKMGYTFNYKTPDTVLVSIKDNFTSDDYAQMIDFLLSGASLVGMHETSIYVKNNKRYPGVGAILKLLAFATSKHYRVIGKPSKLFFDEALMRLGTQVSLPSFNDITIISDDVKGDLGGAKELGMKTIFVTSGKYKNAKEIVPFLGEELKPDLIYSNMQEILESL